ncbi:aminoglycoside phosphotransferase family protein [Cohnella fermenti]|uniref:Aminoglycoside phosphotransferase family protein n=2 Tax=Cohnella fermenti TaxID=2565925 RepID=A0A4S4BK20_9BACL|nr:aminoglycoside phosphotransferase family protein [Cohnella fermenti]
MAGIFGTAIRETKELEDGWANAAYAITMEDGRRAVLKAAPPEGARLMRYERNLMRTEVEVTRRVGELGTVPVPAIYKHDDSRTIVPVEYFVMEFLEGTPYSAARNGMSLEERERIERELGRYNRLINGIKGERFGLYSWGAEGKPTWREAFGQMAENVLLDGEEAGVELPAAYEEVRRRIAAVLPALREADEPRLAHWDLWDGNVFVKDGRITGIIDFERAMWADPLIEHYFSRFNGSAAYYEGYGRGELTGGERIRRSLYDLYLDLILHIECAYRGYENEDHIRWARDNAKEGWERFLNSTNGGETG